MIRKYILPLALLVSSANALDLRYGQGDFEWSVGVADLDDRSVTLDDTVITIAEQHANFKDSPWYYFGKVDIHSSDKLDKITDLADSAVDKLPFSPSDIGPFPSSFEVSGIDLDIGIGYDIARDENGYFGIGFVTGISTPFMEMHNYLEAYDYLSTLLEETSTDVETYKFGISVQGEYNITPEFSIYGTGIYAGQTGTLANDLIASDFDVTGTYSSMDLGIKFYPSGVVEDETNFYINAGYSYKHWEIDDMDVNVGGILNTNLSSVVNTDMTSDFVYVGVGFTF
jgi:hypothetical protein